MQKPFRELGEIIDMIATTGLDVSYAYEDLVFSEHSVFIIKFDDTKKKSLHLYFNNDCDDDAAGEIKQKLIQASTEKGLDLVLKGSFRLNQKESTEEIEVAFFDIYSEPNPLNN